MTNPTNEYKISDTKGQFAHAVKDGRAMNDVSWTSGRILLSNRRLVLVEAGGKRTIPLSQISGLAGRHDATQAVARVSGYVSFHVGEDVLLVAAESHEEFERDVYRAFLDERVLLAKHPAVAGGVVQDTSWEKARFKVGEDGLDAALESGSLVTFDLDDISGLRTAERTVEGEPRPVIEVEHTEGSTNVQTHISGSPHRCAFVESFLRKGERRSAANVELSSADEEVLMALYSGVSPFEIPAFLDMGVDDVEERFERLVEVEILDEVRLRREVALTPRGRNVASEAMNRQ